MSFQIISINSLRTKNIQDTVVKESFCDCLLSSQATFCLHIECKKIVTCVSQALLHSQA